MIRQKINGVSLNDTILGMYQQGDTLGDISETLHISVGSVRSRIPKEFRRQGGRRSVNLNKLAEKAGFVSFKDMVRNKMTPKEVAYELGVSVSVIYKRLK